MNNELSQSHTRKNHGRPILSGSALKLIAVCSMLIDHTAAHLLYDVPSQSQTIFTLFGHSFLWFDLMRGIGRLAFPIFCFLIGEGFRHTRNRRKYGLNLLIFALLSEPVWDLLHFNRAFIPGSQNVFFTLFLGYVGIYALEELSEHREKWLLMGLLVLLASVLNADYGLHGFILVVLLYGLRHNPVARALSVCGLLSSTWLAWLAVIPMGLYNGERGFIRGRVGKYAFYLVYPVHMAVLYLLKYRIR